MARLGVLRFVKGSPGDNQFVGKVFTQLGVGGHLFVQHYLDGMFAGVRPQFLDEVVQVEAGVAIERGAAGEGSGDESEGAVEGAVQSAQAAGMTVRELSRLWRYKYGRVPED